MLDVLDSRIGERELINHHAHGLAEARVVGVFIEDRRLDDQRLFVRELRLTAVDVSTPGFRGKVVRKPRRPYAIEDGVAERPRTRMGEDRQYFMGDLGCGMNRETSLRTNHDAAQGRAWRHGIEDSPILLHIVV